MYNPINLSTDILHNKAIVESMQLDPLKENSNNVLSDMDTLYTEAVFNNGKSKITGIVDKMQKAKDLLLESIKDQDETTDAKNKASKKDKATITIKKFDPKAYWRSQQYKDLEDEIQKVFGFRTVQIQPFIEKYNSKDKKFESKVMNCYVYHSDRYPIDGLVTDNGFYDKTHSLVMDIRISLGLVKELTAEEIVAVLLHEFGHNVDPAIVDIHYAETNILSKYLTDRKKALNKNEEKLLKETEKKKNGFGILILLFYAAFFIGIGLTSIINWIYEKIVGKKKLEQKELEKIKTAIKNDKNEFNRQNYSEAFADNFARMYGFGPQLMSALKKIDDEMHNELNSYYKKDIARRKAISNITINMIGDVHKTDIHRIHALINEYKKDINDPNTPAAVKKNLQEDLAELEKVLDQYLNHKDEFQKRVNNLIYDELNKMDKNKEKAIKEGFEFFDESVSIEKLSPELQDILKKAIKEKIKDNENNKIKTININDLDSFDEPINEDAVMSDKDKKTLINLVKSKTPISLDSLDDEYNKSNSNGKKKIEPIKILLIDESTYTESKKAYEELRKREETINSSERAKIREIFGNSKECSFAKDKNGYYCYTHRCRSKSYPTIEDIPMKDVEFVRSTS